MKRKKIITTWVKIYPTICKNLSKKGGAVYNPPNFKEIKKMEYYYLLID